MRCFVRQQPSAHSCRGCPSPPFLSAPFRFFAQRSRSRSSNVTTCRRPASVPIAHHLCLLRRIGERALLLDSIRLGKSIGVGCTPSTSHALALPLTTRPLLPPATPLDPGYDHHNTSHGCYSYASRHEDGHDGHGDIRAAIAAMKAQQPEKLGRS